jgi:hypothetical protein
MSGSKEVLRTNWQCHWDGLGVVGLQSFYMLWKSAMRINVCRRFKGVLFNSPRLHHLYIQIVYSYLSATIGSTPMARRAGSSDAVTATTDNSTAMPQ